MGLERVIKRHLAEMRVTDRLSDLCYTHDFLRQVAPNHAELKYLSVERKRHSKFNTTFEQANPTFDARHFAEFDKRFVIRTGFLGLGTDLAGTLDAYTNVLRHELVKEALKAHQSLRDKKPQHELLCLVDPEQLISFRNEDWGTVLKKVAEKFDHLAHDSETNLNGYYNALAGYVLALRTAAQ